MSVPNLQHIVEQVYARGGFTLSTLEGCGEFTRTCAQELHAADKRFMLLKKKPGRTHVVDRNGRLHGADVVLFVESPSKAIAVDIIGNSASPSAGPAWMLDHDKRTRQPVYRYSAADGFPPDYEAEPSTTEPAPSEPTSPPSSDLEARISAIERVLRHHRLLP